MKKKYVAELEGFSNKKNEVFKLKKEIITKNQEFSELTKELNLLALQVIPLSQGAISNWLLG